MTSWEYVGLVVVLPVMLGGAVALMALLMRRARNRKPDGPRVRRRPIRHAAIEGEPRPLRPRMAASAAEQRSIGLAKTAGVTQKCLRTSV